MSLPNPQYFYDHNQQRWYRPNADYNWQTNQWEPEWMPINWSPDAPATPQSNTESKRRDSFLIGSSPASSEPYASPSTYGPAQAAAAGVQFGPTSPGHQSIQQEQYPTQVSYGQGSPFSTLYGKFHPSYRPDLTVPGNANPYSGYNLPSREGPSVEGHYNSNFPASDENLHYETIDPSYYVRDNKFFHEGRVFAIILTENAGSTVTSYNSSISEVKYKGHFVHTQIRRFVVVRQRREFCYACPIFTYSNRATLKRGVRPEEHGIAYTHGQAPKLLRGETGIRKSAIAVLMANSEPVLHIASRIYYGIHHPIQYNVKVKDIGQVVKNDMPKLIGNWKQEDGGGETRQAPEVTATAEEPELTRVVEEELVEGGGERRRGVVEQRRKSTAQNDIHLYHAQNNAYGYDSQINPHGYHPRYNTYGYHPQNNPQGYHPQSPFSYHYHPYYNPQGYHAEINFYGYHPQSNPYSYHQQSNQYGFHPQHSPYAYHPHYNPRGYHYQYRPEGYHPTINPTTYHPQYNPQGIDEQDSSDDSSDDGDDGNDGDDGDDGDGSNDAGAEGQGGANYDNDNTVDEVTQGMHRTTM